MLRPPLGRVVLGYDPVTVDALFDLVWPALEGSDVERARALEALRRTGFAVVVHGYDRCHVDVLVERLVAALSRPEGAVPRPRSQGVPAEPDPAMDAGVREVATCKSRGRVVTCLVLGLVFVAPVNLWVPGMPARPVAVWVVTGTLGVAVLLLGLFLMVVRLEWSGEVLCVVVGPWRRGVSMRDLTDVRQRPIRGGVELVLRDGQGRRLVLDDTLFNREEEWKPALLAAARAAGAHVGLGVEPLLRRPQRR
jgi:hypothetical protein